MSIRTSLTLFLIEQEGTGPVVEAALPQMKASPGKPAERPAVVCCAAFSGWSGPRELGSALCHCVLTPGPVGTYYMLID